MRNQQRGDTRKNTPYLNITRKSVAILVIFAFLAIGFSSAQEKTSKVTAPVKEKSELFALALSALGTAVPISIYLFGGDWRTLAYGGIFGPSLGYFYGGLPGRAFVCMGLRTLGVGAAFAALLLIFTPDASMAPIFWWGGIGAFAGLTIYDVVAVYGAVKKRNEKLRRSIVMISPLIIPQTKTIGFALQAQF
jgi:hypothetical protein